MYDIHLLLYCSIAEINDHLANSPAYMVAMECITYLLKEGLETDKIFRIPGNVGKLKKYLEVIDSYKVSALTVPHEPLSISYYYRSQV